MWLPITLAYQPAHLLLLLTRLRNSANNALIPVSSVLLYLSVPTASLIISLKHSALLALPYAPMVPLPMPVHRNANSAIWLSVRRARIARIHAWLVLSIFTLIKIPRTVWIPAVQLITPIYSQELARAAHFLAKHAQRWICVKAVRLTTNFSSADATHNVL